MHNMLIYMIVHICSYLPMLSLVGGMAKPLEHYTPAQAKQPRAAKPAPEVGEGARRPPAQA